MVICDSRGIVSSERTDLNESKKELCKITNKYNVSGTLADAVAGKDVFIGVSKPDILTSEMIRSMSPMPLVFAMSNPEPEVDPEVAKSAGAYIIGTGRSDYPNQINNLLAFPGIFRGALDAGATSITLDMKLAAAKAIANTLSIHELTPDRVIPSPLDDNVGKNVAQAVASAWNEKDK